MTSKKRLIDANEIEELFYKQIECGATDLMDAFDFALEDAQTVDAVEVVRCKDCVNYCGFEHCRNGICDVDAVSKRAVCANDYCSYGERREDGEID